MLKKEDQLSSAQWGALLALLLMDYGIEISNPVGLQSRFAYLTEVAVLDRERAKKA